MKTLRGERKFNFDDVENPSNPPTEYLEYLDQTYFTNNKPDIITFFNRPNELIKKDLKVDKVKTIMQEHVIDFIDKNVDMAIFKKKTLQKRHTWYYNNLNSCKNTPWYR